MLNSRIKRVEENIQQELARIVHYNLSDPRVKSATVTSVRVTRDLSEATAQVTALDDSPGHMAEVLAGLNAARGYIKRLLAERLDMKRLPDLHFRQDTTLRYGQHMDEIFRTIEKERPEETPAEPLEDAAEEPPETQTE